MSPTAQRLLPSTSTTLGAYADGRGVHFSVCAEEAEQVELALFDVSGRHERRRLAMPECIDGVWQGYLPGATVGLQYGYRVYGPFEPREGLRFNPHKLLIDPYARRLAGELRWHDALFGYRIGSPRGDLSLDRRDSAPYLPKAVVSAEHFDWSGDRPPRTPWHDTVIYELHVGGFSRRREEIPARERGTFAGLGHPASIDYLRRLGVTAVELLPVHTFVNDRHLVERGLSNYWGYNTLNYFSPHPGYLSDGNPAEMKWAVQQLHNAGIEVILDVVYNHTCEGNEMGPTLSWRGFDNRGYYRLLDDEPRFYINDTGCGNMLDLTRHRVIQMVMDSLRYWVREFHVDGFRFDLGVSLGRERYGFDPDCGFFNALLQDPELARVKLISEPWDLGPGGFQLGNHPSRFGEWNSLFRDDVRRYWRGDDGLRGALAQRLEGSAHEFHRDCRRPSSSINFITAHDGFTLHDLVSYNDKHNDANGEHNGDGSDHNTSCNWGHEGATDDTDIAALRQQIMRNLLTTLLVSAGTPMLLAGDEFGQTQHGNNNAYCQDNTLSWLDWSLLKQSAGRTQHTFTARLIALRKQYSLLGENIFHADDDAIAPDMNARFWFDESGTELQQDDWHNTVARVLGLRRARRHDNGDIEIVALLFNGDSSAHQFHLPHPAQNYRLLLRTDNPDADESILQDGVSTLAAHSVQILAATQSGQPRAEPPSP